MVTQRPWGTYEVIRNSEDENFVEKNRGLAFKQIVAAIARA